MLKHSSSTCKLVYISRIRCSNPELVVSIMHGLLDRGLLLTRRLLNQVFIVDKLKSSPWFINGIYFNKSNTTGATSVAEYVYSSGGSCCSICHITCLHDFSSVLWCPLRFLCKNDVYSNSLCRGFKFYLCFFCLLLLIYIHWCPTWFPYQMIFVSFNSNTTGAWH